MRAHSSPRRRVLAVLITLTMLLTVAPMGASVATSGEPQASGQGEKRSEGRSGEVRDRDRGSDRGERERGKEHEQRDHDRGGDDKKHRDEKGDEKKDEDEGKKVWVCKMVGSPGDARLSTGKNPIHVSVNATDGKNAFNDAHPSFVVDGPDDDRCVKDEKKDKEEKEEKEKKDEKRDDVKDVKDEEDVEDEVEDKDKRDKEDERKEKRERDKVKDVDDDVRDVDEEVKEIVVEREVTRVVTDEREIVPPTRIDTGAGGGTDSGAVSPAWLALLALGALGGAAFLRGFSRRTRR